MNKNVKGLIVVLVVAGIGYFAYKKFVKPDNRKVVITFLDLVFGKAPEHTSFINNADKGYVDAWAKAIMNGDETFEYNGKILVTRGGSTKK